VNRDRAWRAFQQAAADWRIGMTGPSAGLLQLMHPGIGAGVAEHSDFFDDPFNRVYRSFPRIWATILTDDDEGARRARAIRDVHRDIKGVDEAGRRYHALDAGTFWWAHATFTVGIIDAHDRFNHRRPGPRRREALYAGSVRWWERYGMTSRPVPADLAAFTAEFERVAACELELTPAAARAVDIALHGRRFELVMAPWPVRAVAKRAAATPARLLAIGCLPAVVRDRFAIPWSAADQAALAVLSTALRQFGRVIPGPVNRWTFEQATRRMGAAFETTMLGSRPAA